MEQDIWYVDPYYSYFSLIVAHAGDVIYLNTCGKSTIVLSSEEAARDLLDKRGAIYSDRPPVPIMDA